MVEKSTALSTTALLFAATALVSLRYKKRAKKGEKSTNVSKESALIASRGVAAMKPPLTYIKSFFKSFEDPCDPVENPKGYIALCVAENKLITDLLAERLVQPGSASAAFSDSQVYGYSSFLGLPVVREALAYFFAKRFLLPDEPSLTVSEALQHISPLHCGIGAGCAALLNYTFFILGEEGDACLIPAPYYAAFESDMSIVAGCQPVAVKQANPSQGPTEEDLESAYQDALKRGLRVKFLLLTNPNNPLGTVYSPTVIRNAVEWARRRGLHTIVDELYALSVHKKTGHGFESVIRVLNNKLGNDVHMIWALSKDFGASGFRVGAVYSQNAQYLEALANMNIFAGVSHPIQMIVAEMLTDDEFVDRFLESARERLRYSYKLCTSKLEEMVIPYIPCEAGIFVYADFSSLMRKKTPEGEALLTEIMMKYARIVLTPGASQRDPKPGSFRICYAWVSPEVLEIAMERLSRLVAKLRRMDWSDLSESTALQSILA